jgi:hypothetical protein
MRAERARRGAANVGKAEHLVQQHLDKRVVASADGVPAVENSVNNACPIRK